MFFGSGTRMGKQWNDADESPVGEKIKTYIVEYNSRPASAPPPETTPADAGAGIDAGGSAGGWYWPLLGAWALIGMLLAALVGMAYLWHRERKNARSNAAR